MAAAPVALVAPLGLAPHHDGSSLQRLRLTVQRLPAPALRQQFIAQLSRQVGNTAIQRVLAADPVAVMAGAGSRAVRRRRIQRQCLTCEEESAPIPDLGAVRRMASAPLQRAPAPAIEAANDRRAAAAGDERESAPAAAEGICPMCGRRGTGACACGQPFLPLQRQAIAREPRRRHPWEKTKGKSPAPGVKPTSAPVPGGTSGPAPAQQDASPPPVNAEARATPENRQLAQVIDALAKLTVPELVKRREEALTGAISTTGDEQRRHLETLHAIEYLASQRDLPDLQYQKGDESRVTGRGMRLSLQERVRRTGSFDKAMAEFATVQGIEPGLGKRMEPHLESFRAERKAFATEFKGQAYLTTERMLTESRQAINEVLKSYGLPVDSASVAAQRVAKGASEEDEAQNVIQAATKSAGVDAPASVKHRKTLADAAEVLKKHQQAVKANWQEHEDLIAQFRQDRSKFNPSLRDKNNKEMDAVRTALRVAWITAERRHPVLATYRHGKDLGAVNPNIREAEVDPLAEVDLGKLDTDTVERQMQAVVAQLLPKMVDIGKAKGLLKDKKDAFTLTLPSVVLLTRTNMFIPKGSIRDGIVSDLVAGAKDDSGLVQTLALALALITLIPSGGASLAIPAAAASIGLAAYSATQEWEKYTTGKTLTNTNLDLARSLSTEEPSLTGFALSLVNLGLEAVPLVGAFNRARKIKNLANVSGDAKVAEHALKEAVDDLNSYGQTLKKPVSGLGDMARREIGADVAAARQQARNELFKKHGKELEHLYKHYPDAATLPATQVDEFLTWKKRLSSETRALFDANPPLWRTYATMNPRVRKMLTLCQSVCVPPFAVGTDLETRILKLIDRHGLPDDDPWLRAFLHDQSDPASLGKALDHLEKAKNARELSLRIRMSNFPTKQKATALVRRSGGVIDQQTALALIYKVGDEKKLIRLLDSMEAADRRWLLELLNKEKDVDKVLARLEAAKAARKAGVPLGVDAKKFREVSRQAAEMTRAQGYNFIDIVAEGSRTRGFSLDINPATGKLEPLFKELGPGRDLDVAVRVSADEFDRIAKASFGVPEYPSAKVDTMLHAIKNGVISAGDARPNLRQVREMIARSLGLDKVDLSIARYPGGKFSSGTAIPMSR